jgi:RNA polymerase sigma-70 factor (ECF subfamily)
VPLPEEKYLHLSDIELIQLYKLNADVVIIGLLYKRHLAMALGVANKYLQPEDEAKDAVMNVFEQLLHTINNHKIENFKSWLYSVVKNFCLMKLRKEKNLTIIREEEGKNIFSFMEKEQLLHQEEEKLKESNLSTLEIAIASLNEEQKTCIELFYLQQKSYAEVVELTGFTLNNVKSYIQNGKRNLKLKMQGAYES